MNLLFSVQCTFDRRAYGICNMGNFDGIPTQFQYATCLFFVLRNSDVCSSAGITAPPRLVAQWPSLIIADSLPVPLGATLVRSLKYSCCFICRLLDLVGGKSPQLADVFDVGVSANGESFTLTSRYID